MAIARITGQGLTTIAVLVVMLWACIIGERVIIRNANAEMHRAVHEIRALRTKRRAEPASTPAPRLRQAPRPAIG